MADTYEGWAILEIMGHRVRAGRIVMDDNPLVRIDCPTADGSEITEYYGRAAIFSLRPCSEEIARDYAKNYGPSHPPRPIQYQDAGALPFYEDDDE